MVLVYLTMIAIVYGLCQYSLYNNEKRLAKYFQSRNKDLNKNKEI